MGFLSGLTDIFTGGLGSVVSGALGFLGGKETNSANQAMSRESMEWQEKMRDTQYQSAVTDLQKAGLNPMLAYAKGGNPTPGAPNVQRMENATQAGINSAMGAATTANVVADTKNKQAQADQINAQTQLIRAQTGNTTSSTANVEQQTRNLQEQIPKIREEVQLIMKQGWNETTRGNLMEAQRKLAEIEHDLTAEKINLTDAQAQTQRIVTQLRQNEVPGAENDAKWERAMGMIERYANFGLNSAGKAVDLIPGKKAIEAVINSAKKAKQ